MNKYFAPSELIINEDGSIFHLHVKPEQLADKVILVGDPGRVPVVAAHFDTQECDISSREFRTITGTYKGKRITVVSTGIGCDNIDIVMNELDALANIDFNSRREKEKLRSLELVRIGTCGGLQPYTPVGTFICSVKSVGFDGLLNFYEGRNAVCDLPLERALLNHLGWNGNLCAPAPYVIDAHPELIERIAADDMVRGITVACGGFFGPQGRQLRIPLADPRQNEKIESFSYNGLQITNFEMESSALAGLARLMGHKATTCCMVIANRVAGEADPSYKNKIDDIAAQKEMAYYDANKNGISVYEKSMTSVVMIPTTDEMEEYYMSRTKTAMDNMARSADSSLQAATDYQSEIVDTSYVVEKMQTVTDDAGRLKEAQDMINKLENGINEISDQLFILDKAYIRYKSQNYVSFTYNNASFAQRINVKKTGMKAAAVLAFMVGLNSLRKVRKNRKGIKKSEKV